MSKKRKIVSIILCAVLAVGIGISMLVTGIAEVEETTAETTVITKAKTEEVSEEKTEETAALPVVDTKAEESSKELDKTKSEEKTERTEQAAAEEKKADANVQEVTENTEEIKTEQSVTEETEQTSANTKIQEETTVKKQEEKTEENKKQEETTITKDTTTAVQKQEEKTVVKTQEESKKAQENEKAEEKIKAAERIAQKQAEAKAKEEKAEKANPAVEEPVKGDKTDWEYAPAWAEDDQKYIRGNLLAAVEARGLTIGAKAYIEEVKESIKAQDDVEINEDADNIAEALAVYAVLTNQTDGFPYEVTVSSEDNAKLLQSVYWNMNEITGVSNGDGNVLRVKRLNIDEAAEVLGLSAEQTEAAKSLMTEDARADVEIILTGSILAKLTDEELSAIEARLPEELSSERKAVLIAALSLEGKIGYFWGGKSYHTGWDERWGELRTVVGSKQDGKVKPLGLDCSGFVSWAFINAAGDQDALGYIGNGTANQYKNSKEIGWNEVQPGDLLFYKNPSAGGINHVGIVMTVDSDGTPKEVIHCASGRNGVVVTGSRGFKYARRPYIYED